MDRKDIIIMSPEELRRVSVINQAIGGLITQVKAAEVIGISDRQVRRFIKRVREEGDTGIIHNLRGKLRNRGIDNEVRSKVLELYNEKYWDFGPTLATEKLCELDGITVSDETLRLWLLGEGRWD